MSEVVIDTRGLSKKERNEHAATALKLVAWATVWTTCRANCPAGRSSEWRLRARLSLTPI